MPADDDQTSAGSLTAGSGETCLDWLCRRAARQGDTPAFVDLDGDATEVGSMTWCEVDRAARKVATYLRGRVAVGDRVVLAFAAGAAFAPALFGCFYAGVIAVPCAPPVRARAGGRALGVLTDSGAPLLLTTKALATSIERALQDTPQAPECIAIETILAAEQGVADVAAPLHRPGMDDVALLQYTSGSTGNPRGVAITHGNIVANMTMLTTWSDACEASNYLSWLPLFHDMGLVVGYLMPLASGGTSHLITPATFARHPAVWLKAASRFRATHSAMPNFAFELCAETVPASDIAGLDLSSLHWVLNAAETIRRSSNDAFLARFGPLGFDRGALLHYYGLAEATVCVTGHTPGRGPLYVPISGAALEAGRVVDSPDDTADRRWIAGVGWSDEASNVVVVDPATGTALGDDAIGEIWASGPSMAQGYWQAPEATAEIFGWRVPGDPRPYFRSGDLGFSREGELFITGRLKELIIVGGRNIYPVDVETTVQDVDPHLVRDRGAAFALDGRETEAVVVVQELRREGSQDVDALLRRVVGAVSTAHGVDVAAVVLIRQGTLPLTSSGKVRRAEARHLWRAGDLKQIAAYQRPEAQAAKPRPAQSAADRHAIETALCAELAGVLDLPVDMIDPDEPMSNFGFGSLAAARLAERVSTRFGVAVSATQFYNTPTVRGVAAWIAAQDVSLPAGQDGAGDDPGQAQGAEDAIAIVGMACRLPGAPDLEAFWSILLAGGDGIAEPPAQRRELIAQLGAAQGLPSRAGYIDGAERFDPAFFRMSKREADLLDPQHRLLLETVWHALEHAGLRPEDLRGRSVGSFVGISTSDYSGLMATDESAADAQFPTGNAHNMAANRLSYLFDWRGPSFAVDTACSSSLVAAHLAVQSLRRGECDVAVVGGVNLILSTRLTQAFHAAGMLSPDGRCKTFDAAADGYVRGEGCGVLVLKSMAAARRDGDRVIAAIKGSALNQDGLSNGITAPNGPAQEAVIRAALADADCAASDVGYVETHGTGTDLGDPIEVSALSEALTPADLGAPRVLLGALKSNIGHLEAAAGVASLIKTALVLSRGVVPANRNFDRANPKLATSLARLEPVLSNRPWPPDRPHRLAGVSGFGFGGANAHLILSAVAAPQVKGDSAAAELLCLSAGSEAGLRALAHSWLGAFAAHPDVTAAAWAVNAARQRGQLSWRLALVGHSVAEFRDGLSEWLEGRGPAVAGRVPKQGAGRIGLAVLADGNGAPVERFDRVLSFARLWQDWGLTPGAVSGAEAAGWVAATVGGLVAPETARRQMVEHALGTGSDADTQLAPVSEAGSLPVIAATRDPARALRRGGCDMVITARSSDDVTSVLTAIGAAWVAGTGIDPAKAASRRVQHFVDLPLMQFDRRLCWYDAPSEGGNLFNTAWRALGAAQAPIAALGAALRPMAALGEVRHAATGLRPRPKPQTPPPVQPVLVDMIATLMGRPPSEIDPQERFVEMGADSIVLTRALRAIEERFSVKLTVRQLFETTPTIETLAAALENEVQARTPQDSTVTAAVDLRAPQPVASGPVSRDVLALFQQTDATMKALIAQQEALRAMIAGQPSQNVALPVVERSAAPAPDSLPLWRPSAEVAPSADRNRALDRLIPRYTEMTAGSKRMAAAFRPRLSDNRASAGFRFSTKEMVYPIVGERAKGAYLWDVDGNRYVDISMGFGANLFGHAPDFVESALRDEIARGFALGPQARLAGEVSDLVCGLTGADRVAFATTGTEAVMTALRLARTVTGRRRIAVFEGAYHGHFDGVLATPGADGSTPMAPGVTDAMVADVIVLPYGEAAALDTLRACAQDLAAIVVEPVQSRRPGLQPAEFLHDLRRIADASGTVLLFDEMITGFRIAAGGAQAHFGVKADLATYGKILGGGLPIGAVAGRADLLDALDGGQWRYGDESFPAAETTFFAGTYNKHPLAMASARATLQRIAETGETLYRELEASSADLAARLDRCFEAAGTSMRINRFGSLFRFTHNDNADAFLFALRTRGVFVWEGRNCFLSTAHGPEEIAAIERAVAGALADASGDEGVSVARAPVAPLRETGRVAEADQVFPLSPAQRHLCLLADLRPGAERAYHESAVLNLPLRIDLDSLERALAAVVARHPSLRTVIDGAAGTQRVLSPEAAPKCLSVRSLAWGEDDQSVLAEVISERFPPGLPAFRVGVLRRADNTDILAIVAHHAVADGISLGIIAQDLASAYVAAMASAGAVTLPAASSFAEFLSRQHRRQDTRRRNLDAWRAALHNPPTLDLPLDRPRRSEPQSAGAAVTAALSRATQQQVADAARRLSVTPVMVYFAAYLLLLHRLCGQRHLVVCLPSDARIETADETVVGDCAQMLPILSRLDPEDTMAGFLSRLRGGMLDAYERADFDFAELLESLDSPADPSRRPLIGAVFNLDQANAVPQGFGPGAQLAEAPVRWAKSDLWLNLTQMSDSVSVRLEYASDLFEAATAGRWIDLYSQMLDAVIEDADRRAQDLSFWQAARQTPVESPQADTVPCWISTVARRFSGQVAIDGAQGLVTYDSLMDRVDALARGLVARGCGPETPVGICMEPSEDLPIVLLGVMRAGGCHVPLDPDQPARRLARMVAGAGCAIVLCDAGTAPLAARIGATAVTLTEMMAQDAPATIPLADPHPDQLAYLMHTSGSTGEPKSVGIPHSALANLLGAMSASPGLAAQDRFLSVTPLGFDIAGLEMFLPLVTGARLRVVPRALRGDPVGLARAMAEFEATAMQATPSMWRMLIESGWQAPSGFKVLCGGEALPSALAQRLCASGATLWNLYGPTETTIWSMRSLVDDPQRIDLGDPVGGTRIHLVDAALDPVPEGAVGEIAIGGAGLARGYGGQAGLTAERFCPDPFSAVPGARLYLTGDLARIDARGRMRHLGRRDQQAKVRGHRIEVGEVEAALETLAHVREVAVLIQNGPGAGGAELVAYVVPDQTAAAPAVEDLRRGLRDALPDYMIPRGFYLIDALPLNANGKLDRAALLGQGAQPVSRSAAFRAPSGATETAIAEVWAQVLARKGEIPPRIGAEDGFFDLGGTSLLLPRVHDLLQHRLKRRFPLVWCVSRPTVRALADELDRRDAPPKDSAVAAGGARAKRRRAALQALKLATDGPTNSEG
jgi:amino acid adenylation domain-containing protein